MSRKDTIASLFTAKALGAPNGEAPDKDRVRTGAIGAMRASLQHISDSARAAAALNEKLLSGTTIVELDPGDLVASPVRDRLSLVADPEFDAFVANIAEQGQRTPILVRPHPAQEGHYQIAYGHRRVQAATKLGKKVKAIVQPLSDDELVVAQGNENLERQDLSYIEKARFAFALEQGGYERATIMAALGTEKGDLSRFISIARQIPGALIEKIGPARKVGRPRWQLLADLLAKSKPRDVETLTTSDAFLAADSDGRFALLIHSLQDRRLPKKAPAESWSTKDGRRAAAITRAPNRTVLAFDDTLVPDFGEFLVTRLDRLYEEFLANASKN